MASLVELETPQPNAVPLSRFRRLTRLRSAVPVPLVSILVVVVIVGLSWALIVPPFQSPDESAHFAYAQSLAERLALPGDRSRPNAFSTDHAMADSFFGASVLAHYSGEMRADWSTQDFAAYLAKARTRPSRSDGGGPNVAASNPPLYYLYADLAYWTSYGGNAFDRLYAMRIWGVSLLVLTVIGAWLLVGEVMGLRRLAQLACATVVGLLPMETFMSTSINPDALLITLWTFALWLAARVVRRGLQPRDALALCMITAAAILTKATAYALVPPVLVALLLGWRRRGGHERRQRKRIVVLAAILPVAAVLGWIALSHGLGRPVINAIASPVGAPVRSFNLRQFLSYLWQFYLPRPSFLTPLRTTLGLPLYDIWLREGWGLFGWLEIEMSNWLYVLLSAVTALIAAVATGIAVQFRDRLKLELVAMFAIALVSLLGGLHLTDYRSILAGDGPVLQGRYLLPLIGLFGLAVALIVSRIPVRWRAPACGGLAALMLLLQVLALSTIVQGYYT
jgi:4-amino-4-deoxy-L-arabinose transferase-like glycosyltransferase